MKYGLQHNGKGKYHLIPFDIEGDELCGTSGIFLFSGPDDLEIMDNGEMYEVSTMLDNFRTKVTDFILETYCKKCIKKALKAVEISAP